MRTSHWLFERFERLSRRERRVIVAGAVISALALITVYGIQPFARRWSEREAAIAAKAEQAARLEALVGARDRLAASVAELRRARDRESARLLSGSTPALAASNLQTLIRGYAERSRVSLQRVDVDRDFEAEESGLVPIGLQLSARGDIYGLVDLLFYLQNGEKLLMIEDLRVQTPFRRGADALLNWTIQLRGFHLPEEDRA